jgi:hypothetical protein
VVTREKEHDMNEGKRNASRAAAASRALIKRGWMPLPSGTKASRRGLRIQSSPISVRFMLDHPGSDRRERYVDDLRADLISLGYIVGEVHSDDAFDGWTSVYAWKPEWDHPGDVPITWRYIVTTQAGQVRVVDLDTKRYVAYCGNNTVDAHELAYKLNHPVTER